MKTKKPTAKLLAQGKAFLALMLSFYEIHHVEGQRYEFVERSTHKIIGYFTFADRSPNHEKTTYVPAAHSGPGVQQHTHTTRAGTDLD